MEEKGQKYFFSYQYYPVRKGWVVAGMLVFLVGTSTLLLFTLKDDPVLDILVAVFGIGLIQLLVWPVYYFFLGARSIEFYSDALYASVYPRRKMEEFAFADLVRVEAKDERSVVLSFKGDRNLSFSSQGFRDEQIFISFLESLKSFVP